jgi:hypothetical protein
MITTILIVLVAVVVLIVIIAVLALHFLRADDSDSFDEGPAEPRNTGRAPADPPRKRTSDGSGRGSRHPEPARPQWANAHPVQDRPAANRDRETGPRPGAADRRNGQSAGSRPVVTTPRPAKPAKPAKAVSAEAQGNSWDSLSDVDYWAELSADKPQVGPAAPAPARSNGATRRGPDDRPARRPAPEGRPARRAESGPVPGAPVPAGSLPVRPRSQPARIGASPSAPPPDLSQTEQFDTRASRAGGSGSNSSNQSLAALARLSGPQPPAAPRADAGQRPARGRRPGARSVPADGQRSPGPRPPQSAGYPGTPAPLDDDPLTSPSFPAINASDSRSYRARRSSGAHSGPQTGPQPAAGRSGRPAESGAQYPVQPRGSQPQAPSSSPVANPYGSYVGAPSRPEVPAYSGAHGNGEQADASWYSGGATGYLPANGFGAGDHNGYNSNGHNGNGHAYPARDPRDSQGSYGAFDYQNLSYADVDYQQVPEADGYPQLNPHPGQFNERGYGEPDLAYGQDGYQGYPGYGPGGR